MLSSLFMMQKIEKLKWLINVVSPLMMQKIEKVKWLINVVFAVYDADNRETKMVD